MSEIGKTYIKNPDPVQAVLLTRENLEEVAKWCGGDSVEVSKPGDPTDVYYGIDYPTLSGKARINLNHYLIRNEFGKFSSLNKETFERVFTERGKREPDWGHHDQPYPKTPANDWNGQR